MQLFWFKIRLFVCLQKVNWPWVYVDKSENSVSKWVNDFELTLAPPPAWKPLHDGGVAVTQCSGVIKLLVWNVLLLSSRESSSLKVSFSHRIDLWKLIQFWTANKSGSRIDFYKPIRLKYGYPYFKNADF